MKTITELTVIGAKVNTCFDALTMVVSSMGLTEDELKDFADYLDEQDTFLPMRDPTTYRDGGSTAIELAKKRVEILQAALPALDREKGIMSRKGTS